LQKGLIEMVALPEFGKPRFFQQFLQHPYLLATSIVWWNAQRIGNRLGYFYVYNTRHIMMECGFLKVRFYFSLVVANIAEV
jgi:hypothetical protein